MFGHGEPVDLELEVRRLEGEILKIRFEQLSVQHDLEDAVQSEHRGLDMVDGARAKQTRCRDIVDDLAKRISDTQDAIADLIPKQPRPGD